ncbi:MAG: DMT family transporter [Microcoleus sp.]
MHDRSSIADSHFTNYQLPITNYQIMFTRLFLFILVAIGGMGLTVQMAWNARLRTSTGSPVLATIISVFVTLISLALVWTSGAIDRGSIPAFNSLPTWAWFGGVFAAYYLVASLIAIPKLGVTAVFSLAIAGQTIAALVLDSTGAFGITQIPLSVSRILGAALLLIGVILIQKY